MASKNGKENTDPQGEGASDELARPKESLLGNRQLSVPGDERFLLRLRGGYLSEKFAQFLKTNGYKPALSQATKGKVPPLVLGPFSKKELAHFVDESWIDPEDTLLKSNDRWRGAATFFPVLKGAFGELDDVTATSTASASGMGFDESVERAALGELPPPNLEMTPTPPGTDENLPSLEVEEFEENGSTQIVGAGETESNPPSGSRGAQDAPTDVSKAKNFSRAQANAQANSQSNSSQSKKMRKEGGAVPSALPLNTGGDNAKRFAMNIPLVGGTIAVIGVAAILFAVAGQKTKHEVTPPPPTAAPANGSLAVGPQVVSPGDWPDSLKPRDPSELYKDDDFLVAKIRPILNGYEKGIPQLSKEDEKVLKGYAAEGTSSWDARRLAANQLAVYYLSSEHPTEAQNILLPISNANAASDPVTLLNLSLINLVANNQGVAKELADVGLRLSPRGVDWVANVIVGMVDGASGKITEATQSFRSALNLSTNNPFVYGVWIQNLARGPNKNDPEIPKLIREALWADPDRLIDSPIRAPLAGHIIVQSALEGFRTGAEKPEAKLTPGQAAFVRWEVEARSRLNPVSQPLSQVMDILVNEAAAQSQLLYAYSLKEQGRIDEASVVMGRLIPLLELEGNFASSWAWTLAGDLQMARKQISQALILYQGALSRNQRDVSAVHGLAMAFRAQGDYAGAQRKLNEALSLDPYFIPSMLRMERIDWQRRSVAQ